MILKKLQMILIIWIGLLLQSGWSSAIFFAKGPETLEIVMTKAIQVCWRTLQPGQPPHPDQPGRTVPVLQGIVYHHFRISF